MTKSEQKPRTLVDFPDTFISRNYSCPNGWENIVHGLTKDLLKIWPNMHVSQVKQKFARLCYYLNRTMPNNIEYQVNERIAEAGRLATQTCEVCGKPGKEVCIDHWYSILCSKCKKEKLDDKTKTHNL